MLLGTCIGVAVVAFLLIFRKTVKNVLSGVFQTCSFIRGGLVGLKDNVLYSRYDKMDELPTRNKEIVIITGGTKGIGLEVVKKLLKCHMHVIIGCRRVEFGLEQVSRIREEGISSGFAEAIELDTSSLKSVKTFTNKVLTKIHKLHVLILNAGTMVTPYTLTEDGFEYQLAVNYMGHAMLVHYLLPLMKETGKNSNKHSRIVSTSSVAHISGYIHFDDINFIKSPYNMTEAYCQSKLAQLMFSIALNRILQREDAKVSTFAVHPGMVNTDLFNGTALKQFFPWILKLFFKTKEKGSTSIVYAAVSPDLEGEGGLYISNCRIIKPSKGARNEAQQERLMQLTEEMLKIKKFGYPRQ